MHTNEVLIRLGLTINEAAVYCAALEHGASTISEISRNASVHRPAAYRIVKHLIDLELMSSSVQGKRRLYVAENPEKLRSRLEETARSFEAALPELMSLHNLTGNRPVIKVFSGFKGVKSVFDDLLATLKKGGVFYRYDSHRNYQDNKKYLPDRYIERACRTGDLYRYIITNERTYLKKIPNARRFLKMFPSSKDLFAYNISQIIYADKVAFIDYSTETAYIIENPMFARFQQQMFMLLFDRL